MLNIIFGIIVFVLSAFICSQTQNLSEFTRQNAQALIYIPLFLLAAGKYLKVMPVFLQAILLALLASVWARLHYAPPSKQVVSVEVLEARQGITRSSGILIVQDHDKNHYSVRGRGWPGDKGTISCSKVCYFRPTSRSISAQHAWRDYARQLRMQITKMPEGIQPWCKALLLGDKSLLESSQVQSFKGLGMYHLLVISGLHIGFIAVVLMSLLKTPILILYSLKIINPIFIPYLVITIRVIGIIVIVLFCLVLGFPVSAQRAALIFTSANILKMIGSRSSRLCAIIFAGAAQILLFPEGIWGLGSALSWGAYLIFSSSNLDRGKTLKDWALETLKIYWFLFLWIYALLNQLTPFAIIFNLLLIPIFSPLFIALFATVFLPPNHNLVWEVFFHLEGFSFVIQYYYNLIGAPFENLVGLYALPPFLRGSCLLWALLLLFKRYKAEFFELRRY